MKTQKTEKSTFQPESVHPDFHSGAGNGVVDPGELAGEVGLRPHGAWLTAYMIRRFGPPLCGSDPYKNLCEWALTTPMDGVWLSVTPYLGDDPSDRDRQGLDSLSFGYRFDENVAISIQTPPPEEAKRYKEFVKRAACWAVKKGICFVWADSKRKESPPRGFQPIVPDSVWAFNRSSETSPILAWSLDGWPKATLRELLRFRYHHGWKFSEVLQAYSDAHKIDRVPLPRWNREVKSKVEDALRVTLRELIRPIYVRDLQFSVSGRVGDDVDAGEPAEAYCNAGYPMRGTGPETQSE